MKIRNGFVSNSSSSSFLVVDGKPGNHIDQKFVGRELVVPQSFPGYESEFGRSCVDHDDFGSRLLFASILAFSVEHYQRTRGMKLDDYSYGPFWKKHDFNDFTGLVAKLRGVLLDNFKCRSVCFTALPSGYEEDDPMQFWSNSRKVKLPRDEDYDETRDAVECYIDHGSSWQERPENLLIFKSNKRLADFLFGKRSYVAERSDEVEWELPKLHDGMWSTLDFERKENTDRINEAGGLYDE